MNNKFDTLILSEEERSVILKNRPKPYFNIHWEKYLKTDYLRTDRIGEVIDFVRYGDIPVTGKSIWWHSLSPPYKSRPELKGISVFEIVNGIEYRPRPKLYSRGDFNTRPKYIGKGKIVGWGTDGEPLIEVIEITK